MRLSCLAVTFAMVCSGVAARVETQQKAVNPDAGVLAEYKKQVATYMDLRRRAQRDVPRLEQTEDPAEIGAAREALAAAIRTSRADAAQGAIFTTEVTALFRRLLSSEMKRREGADTKRTMAEDAPAKVSLTVNASYPEGQPLPTVPPNVLASLPRLPEGLEYRIIHRHLILRDVDANLIIDVMPNAIP